MHKHPQFVLYNVNIQLTLILYYNRNNLFISRNFIIKYSIAYQKCIHL